MDTVVLAAALAANPDADLIVLAHPSRGAAPAWGGLLGERPPAGCELWGFAPSMAGEAHPAVWAAEVIDAAPALFHLPVVPEAWLPAPERRAAFVRALVAGAPGGGGPAQRRARAVLETAVGVAGGARVVVAVRPARRTSAGVGGVKGVPALLEEVRSFVPRGAVLVLLVAADDPAAETTEVPVVRVSGGPGLPRETPFAAFGAELFSPLLVLAVHGAALSTETLAGLLERDEPAVVRVLEVLYARGLLTEGLLGPHGLGHALASPAVEDEVWAEAKRRGLAPRRLLENAIGFFGDRRTARTDAVTTARRLWEAARRHGAADLVSEVLPLVTDVLRARGLAGWVLDGLDARFADAAFVRALEPDEAARLHAAAAVLCAGELPKRAAALARHVAGVGDGAPAPLRADMLNLAARAAVAEGDAPRARARLAKARAVIAHAGDALIEGRLESTEAMIAESAGDPYAAALAYARAAALFERAGAADAANAAAAAAERLRT